MAPHKDAPETASRWIRLRLAVTSNQVLALRQWLHRVIGHLARVYVVEIDCHHGQATVHIELEPGAHDAAMHIIATTLPAAGFGTAEELMDEHAADWRCPHGKRRPTCRARRGAARRNATLWGMRVLMTTPTQSNQVAASAQSGCIETTSSSRASTGQQLHSLDV